MKSVTCERKLPDVVVVVVVSMKLLRSNGGVMDVVDAATRDQASTRHVRRRGCNRAADQAARKSAVHLGDRKAARCVQQPFRRDRYADAQA